MVSAFGTRPRRGGRFSNVSADLASTIFRVNDSPRGETKSKKKQVRKEIKSFITTKSLNFPPPLASPQDHLVTRNVVYINQVPLPIG